MTKSSTSSSVSSERALQERPTLHAARVTGPPPVHITGNRHVRPLCLYPRSHLPPHPVCPRSLVARGNNTILRLPHPPSSHRYQRLPLSRQRRVSEEGVGYARALLLLLPLQRAREITLFTSGLADIFVLNPVSGFAPYTGL